jgi:succinylglutamic semialdehyde dehydrogenase
LLSGNAVLVKPSEKAPYSSQLYFEAAEAAELPPGLLQLLQGNGEFATRLIRRSEVDGVLATCSYEVGAKIQKELAEAPEKIIALEMGGKNACIVWKGSNVDQVASDLIRSSFLTTGQRCSALSRAYVHPSLLETLVAKVHALAKELSIHHPFHDDPKPFMGPIISSQAQANFLRYGKIAESEGATAIMRGKPLEGSARMSRTPIPEGSYVTPSIHLVEKWDPKSIYQNHEIFGPDLFFAPITSLEDGIQAANSTQYGLTFSMFGGSEEEFTSVADEIEAGCVYWNRPTVGASSRLPFGGWKRSGNHRPAGIFSLYYTTQAQSRIL